MNEAKKATVNVKRERHAVTPHYMLHDRKDTPNMVGIKGNNGKATHTKISIEFLILVAFAVVVVTAVKTFATTAPWHAKATIEDQQHSRNVLAESEIAADSTGKDIQDQNLVKFLFSNLDGEEGNEGACAAKALPLLGYCI